MKLVLYLSFKKWATTIKVDVKDRARLNRENQHQPYHKPSLTIPVENLPLHKRLKWRYQ